MNVRRYCVRAAVVCLAALALSAPLGAAPQKTAAGPTPIRVDGKIIKGYIDYMASDDKDGRRSLTPGYEKVAEWAAGKFKEWGLKPAGDNGTFLQDVPVSGRGSGQPWTTGVPALTVDGRAFYLNDGDFTVEPASTPGAQADAEVVFVGYGISAPGKGLDEYAGVDVKGKVVLALKGSPKDAPPARGMFGAAVAEPKDNEAWTEEARDQAKIKTAYEKGAAAVLLFNVDRLAPAQQPQSAAALMARAMMAAEPGSPYTRPFVVVSDVSERVFRHVMFRNPQETSRGFLARMDGWRRDIRDRKAHSMATGVKAQVKGFQTITFFSEKLKNNVSRNVIGKVEGTDPKLKAQVVVVGGHLDHVGMTNGVIFNGADDNASGSATVMEMARLVAANAATIKPKRTIYFALWCAEEMGLIGSEYLGEAPDRRRIARQRRRELQQRHGGARRSDRRTGRPQLPRHLGRDHEAPGARRGEGPRDLHRGPRRQRLLRLHRAGHRVAGAHDGGRCRPPGLPRRRRRPGEDGPGDAAAERPVRAAGHRQRRQRDDGQPAHPRSPALVQRDAAQPAQLLDGADRRRGDGAVRRRSSRAQRRARAST